MIIKRLVPAILTVVLAFLLSVTVFAAEKVDVSKKTSLTVNYLYNGTIPVPNAEFSLYQIGMVAETGELIIDSRFSDYGIKLDLTNADDWATMAETVYGYLQRDNIAFSANGKTDKRGKMVLRELPVGLYLLAGASLTNEDFVYTAMPFFLTLPSVNSEKAWEYDVTVKPKCNRHTLPPEEVVSRKVMKVWKNDEGQHRPQQISVQLLCNGRVYDAQTLSAENNWRYEWENLDAVCEWSLVEENVPTGYTVKVTQEDATFILTNTYTTPSPPKNPSKLPQTGLYWWPVFLAGGAGMLLVMLGVCLKMKKRKKND